MPGLDISKNISEVQPDKAESGSRPTLLDTGGTDGELVNVGSQTQTDISPPPNLVNDTSGYKLEWKGSPNFWSGRNGQTAMAICNHIMQGNIEGANSWFKDRRSEVSAHFGVARDGRIWQWVRTEDSAWANGILQNPDTSLNWLAECVRNKINPNHRTLSIEHEGRSGEGFPEEQYKATLWLHRHLCINYKIPNDRQHIIGHYQITAHDRADCPGRAFPWERLLNDLADVSVQQPAQKWTEGVAGVVYVKFGPGKVNINKSYVRSRPSLGEKDGTLLRTLPTGAILHFDAYTHKGPAYHNSSSWYLIADEDGGGWIHSTMITGTPDK